MNKFKDLSFALSMLRQVANDPTLEPVDRAAIRRGYDKLRRLKRSGPMDRQQVFEAVRLAAEALYNAYRKR